MFVLFLYPFFLSVLTWFSLSGRRSAAELTCVWCRAKWHRGGKNESDASPSSGRYVNLGGVAGLSGKRDTSSCTRLCFILRVIQPGNDAISIRSSQLAVGGSFLNSKPKRSRVY